MWPEDFETAYPYSCPICLSMYDGCECGHCGYDAYEDAHDHHYYEAFAQASA